MRALWRRWRQGWARCPATPPSPRPRGWQWKGSEMTYWPILTVRAMPLLALIGLCFPLAACGGSTASGARLSAPPPSLVQTCQAAVALPARDLMQAEVERFWRADRARLAACRDKHQGLAEWAGGVVQAGR